jgi:hypothetical protein
MCAAHALGMHSPVFVFAASSLLSGLVLACSAAPKAEAAKTAGASLAAPAASSSAMPGDDEAEVRARLLAARTDLCVGRGPGLSGICLSRTLSQNGICAAPAPYEIRGFADPAQAARDLAAATTPRAPGALSCRRVGFYFDGTTCAEASPTSDGCRCDALDCALWRTRAMCELARQECSGRAASP